MTLATVVWKNLLRRPTRTALTLLGIGVGIAAVVALTGFARGLEAGWQNAYDARAVDLVLTKITSRSPLPAVFDIEQAAPLLADPAVKASAALLNDMMGIEEASTVIVLGLENPSFLWDHLKLIEGRRPDPAAQLELVLGTVAAETLGKKIGDPVQIEFDEFTVVGIVESPALVENGAVILPLASMQKATERTGKANFLNIRVQNPETDLPALRRIVEERMPGFRALAANEVASRNSGIEAARAMSWATSVIALVVGAFGVANTMLMSVFERIREIGILLAIGWRPRQVMAMILGESLLLSLLGGALGCAAGVAAVKLLERTELLRGKLEADTGPALFLTAFGVALLLGALAGLYPAWRASRLQPSEALRNE